MFRDWILWLSSLAPDQLVSFLAGVLVIDGLRYTGAKLLLMFWDMACDLVKGPCRSRPVPGAEFRPSVTLLLAGYNEAEGIVATLESTWGSYPDMEVLVVDDGSSDEMTREARRFARTHPGVTVLRRSRRGGKSSALNFGLSVAKGEIVVVVDADSELGPRAIERIISPFADPGVGAVGGMIYGRDPFRSLLTWLQAYEYLSCILVGRLLMARLGMLAIISGAFGAFRRSALKRVRGWDVGPPEDLDLTLSLRKCGYRIEFASDAECYTDLPTTWRALIRQRTRWDQSGVVRNFLRKHVDLLAFWRPSFRLTDGLIVLENWIVGLVCPIAIGAWLTWCLFAAPPGTASWPLFATVYVTTTILECFQALTVLYYSQNRRRDVWVCLVVPLVPLYQFLLLLVRSAAHVRELVWRASSRDNYVPEHVRRATWHW
jgi:cellulose synthase/poly-beta-1,6-N-acetylglucosamine synthase-like glycosyltransferase